MSTEEKDFNGTLILAVVVVNIDEPSKKLEQIFNQKQFKVLELLRILLVSNRCLPFC